MTLRELSLRLSAAGIESALADTVSLASHVSGSSPASLYARLDDELEGEDWLPELLCLSERRRLREPLQYILGKWEFYGDEYKVTPDTLIPRSETELLVDFALAQLARGSRIADLCCGSGCIGIAICRHADVFCDSVDISSPTLRTAKENAAALGVKDKISFIRGDVTTAPLPTGAIYDMIVSNPPYIKTSAIETLAPELSHEPRIALDGGEDGMKFYRGILKNYSPCLAPGGMFVFEIGFDLSESITALAREHGFSCAVYPDLGGVPRMAVLKRVGAK